MPSLASRLNKSGRVKPPREPLWKGPEVDGITQSMLARFLVCRERFRLYAIEGLRPADEFNHRLEYGNMWHVCEEEHAKDKGHGTAWASKLLAYAKSLTQRYRQSSEQINHWYRVCLTQFPQYVAFWESHSDVVDRTPIVQEYVFDVPYTLPSGRMVRLRGKFDSVDVIGKKGTDRGMYLKENKTKGDVDERKLTKQLTFDLQSMFYLTALKKCKGFVSNTAPLRGVLYNVVRRPLSGGKGTISRHKATKNKPAESADEFYDRLGGIIAADPKHYFMRWKVDVTSGEIDRFRLECLDPILEQLCSWYDYITGPIADRIGPYPFHPRLHYRFPYGVYNPMLEDRSSDLDEYLATGSEVGLTRAESLFGELG